MQFLCFVTERMWSRVEERSLCLVALSGFKKEVLTCPEGELQANQELTEHSLILGNMG